MFNTVVKSKTTSIEQRLDVLERQIKDVENRHKNVTMMIGQLRKVVKAGADPERDKGTV